MTIYCYINLSVIYTCEPVLLDQRVGPAQCSSRLRLPAVAYFVRAKIINWNGEVHWKQFDFEVQDKDKEGFLCTLGKLAILSTSTIQSSNLEFQQVDDDEDDEQQLGQRTLFK